MKNHVNLKVHAVSLAGFIIIVLAMTFPLGFDSHNYVLAEHLDGTAALYNFWWFYYSLFELHVSPWHNPLINYPEGYSMVFYPIYFIYGIISIPFQAFLGTPEGVPAFFNFITVASFILTGYFTFLLLRYLTAAAWGAPKNAASFAAGLIFAFMPFRFWNISRCHVTCTEFLVLAVYFYLLAFEQRKKRHAVGLGVALVMLAYSSPNYMTYLAIFIILHMAFMISTKKELVFSRAFLRQAGIAAAIFAPLFVPLAVEVIRQILDPSMAFVPPLKDQADYSGNLLGYIVPGYNLRLYRPILHLLPAVDPDMTRAHGVGGYEIFLGYSVIVMAAVTLAAARPRNAWLWICTALVFFILSLGPRLHAGTTDFYSFSLPHKWLSSFMPVFRVDRSPVRFMVMTEFSLAVICGLGLAWASEKLSASKYRLLAACAGLIACMEFFQAPLPVSAVPIPEFHRGLAQEPGDFAVLDLPILPDIYRYSGTYQTYHKKKLIIDLTRRQTDSGVFKDPVFYYLSEPLRWDVLSKKDKAEVEEKIKAELTRKKVKYVVLFTRFMEQDNIRLCQELLARLGPEKHWKEGELFIIFRFSVDTN